MPVDPADTMKKIEEVRQMQQQTELLRQQTEALREQNQLPPAVRAVPEPAGDAAPRHSAGTDRFGLLTGRGWRALAEMERVYFLAGAGEALTVAANAEVAKYFPAGLGDGEFAEAVTRFYEDTANRPIPVVHAIRAVSMKANGEDPTVFEKAVAAMRKEALELEKEPAPRQTEASREQSGEKQPATALPSDSGRPPGGTALFEPSLRMPSIAIGLCGIYSVGMTSGEAQSMAKASGCSISKLGPSALVSGSDGKMLGAINFITVANGQERAMRAARILATGLDFKAIELMIALVRSLTDLGCSETSAHLAAPKGFSADVSTNDLSFSCGERDLVLTWSVRSSPGGDHNEFFSLEETVSGLAGVMKLYGLK